MKTFRVDYPTGYMNIVIINFFGQVNKRKVIQFLRFAALACTSEQKQELISSIKSERERMKEGLQQLIEIETQWIEKCTNLLDHKVSMPMTPAKRDMIRICKNLERSLDLIKEVWKI